MCKWNDACQKLYGWNELKSEVGVSVSMVVDVDVNEGEKLEGFK